MPSGLYQPRVFALSEAREFVEKPLASTWETRTLLPYTRDNAAEYPCASDAEFASDPSTRICTLPARPAARLLPNPAPTTVVAIAACPQQPAAQAFVAGCGQRLVACVRNRKRRFHAIGPASELTKGDAEQKQKEFTKAINGGGPPCQ